MPRDFVHLHVHSEYSLLEGMIRLDDLVDRVAASGQTAVALTDLGNMFGSRGFYRRALQNGIRPILGVEALLARGSLRDRGDDREQNTQPDSDPFHLTLLAMTDEGWKNLMGLVSESWLFGKHGKPLTDREVLRSRSAGLVALSGCSKGEIARALAVGDFAAAERTGREMIEIFGRENFFVEIIDHGLERERRLVPDLLRLADRLGVPPVATNDCHYLDRADARAQEALFAIGTGRSLSEPDRPRLGGDEFFLKSTEEMFATFSRWSVDALTNTAALAARSSVALAEGTPHLPAYTPPDGSPEDVYFRRVAEDGLEVRLRKMRRDGDARRKGLSPAEYRERLQVEIGVIVETGLAGYFLVVWDLVRFARKTGVAAGPGRGAIPSSLVAYSLEITDIDPLEHDLLFERFLVPGRLPPPNIGVDFGQHGREELFAYLSMKYGGSFARVLEIGRFTREELVKNVGRVLGIPSAKTSKISKLLRADILEDRQASESPATLEAWATRAPEVRELLEITDKLHRIACKARAAAAAVVVSPGPLLEEIPLWRTSDGAVATQYEQNELSRAGFLVTDLLGLRTLDTIDRATKSLAAAGTVVNLDEVPMDDSETFRLFQKGRTNGVFQFESSGMKDILRRFKPATFSDLVALSAVYRIGPLDAGIVDELIARKRGKKPIRRLHPAVDDLLLETYGLIFYQEQFMRVAERLAGFSLAEADLFRRILGKKDKDRLVEQRQMFLEGCRKKEIPPRAAGRIFDRIEPFARHVFNKSHAVAYTLLAYRTAYLKARYPSHFYAAALTSCTDSPAEITKYLRECQAMSIEVLPPDRDGEHRGFVAVGNAIRFGLDAAERIGPARLARILASPRDPRSKRSRS